MRTLLLLFAATLWLPSIDHDAVADSPGMIEFFSLGKRRQGLLLAGTSAETIVLSRDGWMHVLDANARSGGFQPTGLPFQPVDPVVLRNELRSDYGGGYEVIATADFLVVQPNGRGDRWPRLFQQSHDGFCAYMSARGVTVRQGSFPMVAVVLPDEQELHSELRRQNIEVGRVAGLYSLNSNRVLTYDGQRQANATVRHEAAHQSAYNSGVHSRINETPRWITEGIGQMFEPAGMTDNRIAAPLQSRVNRDSLNYLRDRYRDRSKMARDMASLVRGPELFDDSMTVADAYHLSWAMMFYLAERQNDRFANLLNHTSARPPFAAYTAAERSVDFGRIIGVDPHHFAVSLDRFLSSL